MTGIWMRVVARIASVCAFALVVASCGDPATDDPRGYSKAPLEQPGVFIKGEPTTEMSELGEPILPPVVDIESTGAQAQQQ